jgi:hypothetical protein
MSYQLLESYKALGPKINQLNDCAKNYRRVCKCNDIDIINGIKECQHLADMENTYAMNVLANCYKSGKHINGTNKEIFEMFKRSADGNNSDGIYNLGLCYVYPLGVEKDDKKSVELLTKAADMGNRDANFNLAEWYEKGIRVEYSLEKAFELYTRASDLGHNAATFDLARWYHKGKYVKKDLKKALCMYGKLAEQNDVAAILNIANFYEKGLVVRKDMSMAIAQYMKIFKMNEGIYTIKVNKLIREYKNNKDIEVPFFRDINSHCAKCYRSDVRRAVYSCNCIPNTRICCDCFLNDDSEYGTCPFCDDYMYG